MWLWALVLGWLSLVAGTAAYRSPESVFQEQLLLRPLADGKVLAHFHFQIDSLHATDSAAAGHPPSASHFHLFPKPIGQIIDRFDVEVLYACLCVDRLGLMGCVVIVVIVIVIVILCRSCI